MTDTTLVEVDDLDSVRQQARPAAGSDPLRALGIRQVVSGPGALGRLPQVLADLGVPDGAVVAVLTDAVPKRCLDRDAVDVVIETAAQRFATRRVVLSSPAGPEVHADESTVAQALEAVAAEGITALVTVGAGTLADIGKVVAQRLDRVHVIVQTAASVNGFADDQSVLLFNGTKRTTPSRWPDALVIDSDVIAAAPLAMTRSGLGDLLSTYTAAADWQLAALVGYDPSYSSAAVAVLRSGIDLTLARAAGLRANEPGAVRALAGSLTRGGLAMGLAGRTAPSSGAEHTVSHLLEMAAAARGRRAAPHGAQVGAASVVVARLWAAMRQRLGSGECVVRPLDESAMRARISAAFLPLDPAGAVVAECWPAYERKLRWVNAHQRELTAVCAEWGRYDDLVGRLLAEPESLAATLRAAGAPAGLTELDPDPGADVVRWAVANCHLMRDRFTIVDLAEVTGGWADDDIDAVL